MIALAVLAAMSGQAIEQIAPPTPPRGAVAATQLDPAARRSPHIAQLPPDARAVAQPEPPPASPPPDPADGERAAVTILTPTTGPLPEAIARELGPEIIERLGREVIAMPDTRPTAPVGKKP